MDLASRDAVLEALGSARAVRWFRPEPVPDHLIDTVVWAGTQASSAHNSQPWEFVVVRDGRLRQAIAAEIRAAVAERDPLPEPQDASGAAIVAGVRNLFENLGEVPALVVVCARNNYPDPDPEERHMWSAIGSATQNMVVAARAVGLGTTITYLHSLAEPQIRALLRVPSDRRIVALMPVGWPVRPAGRLKRRRLAEVSHRDRWAEDGGPT